MLKRVKITKIEEVKNIKRTFDLEVEDNHNFFIDFKILSHNCFASQIIEDVPETILKQSKYIFVPATADVQTIKTILVSTGNTKNIQTSVRDAMKLKRIMKQVKYSWIVINRMSGQMDLVKPLSPLSSHLQTST